MSSPAGARPSPDGRTQDGHLLVSKRTGDDADAAHVELVALELAQAHAGAPATAAQRSAIAGVGGQEPRFASRSQGNGWRVEMPGTPSDNTSVTAVLASFQQDGYGAELWAKPGGQVLCGACRVTSPAARFTIGRERRLEGASDPDDMQLVVGATCPSCGARGVISLHYGPNAGEDDADVLVALPR